MKLQNITQQQIQGALDATNRLFADNIKFKRLSPCGRGFTLTLSVKDSRGRGSRKSIYGRRICAACWHVYGTFIDNVFIVAPLAKVHTTGSVPLVGTTQVTYTAQTWKWTDRNIGSEYQPFMYSEACDCND